VVFFFVIIFFCLCFFFFNFVCLFVFVCVCVFFLFCDLILRFILLVRSVCLLFPVCLLFLVRNREKDRMQEREKRLFNSLTDEQLLLQLKEQLFINFNISGNGEAVVEVILRFFCLFWCFYTVY
jgi:hypothetical protein